MKLTKNKFVDRMKPNNQYLGYINVGFYLLIPILLGVFLGLSIDRWLNMRPVFTIIFIILGTISSFYNLYKVAKGE